MSGIFGMIIKEARNGFREHSKVIRIIGGIMIVFGIVVLFANKEERAGNIADNLVETKEVLPENEGKLVIVSGTPTLENDGILIDEEANLQVKNAIRYVRRPLQNVYVEKSKEVVVDEGKDKGSPHDDVTETVYYIESEWIPSYADREPWSKEKGHQYDNPEKVDISECNSDNHFCFGEFMVADSSKLLEHAETKERGFTVEEIENNCKDYISSLGMNLKVLAKDSNNFAMLSNGDEIGNIHVEFYYRTLGNIKPLTVIGRQEGNKIVFDEKEELSDSEHVYGRILSKDEFIKEISDEDAGSRKLGFVFLIIGGIGILLTLSFKRRK